MAALLKSRECVLQLRHELVVSAPPVAGEHLPQQFDFALAGDGPRGNVHTDKDRGMMSVYDDMRDELEKHEFMFGIPRGRLAVALDLLTDALVLVGQHGVYCQSARQAGKPAMDIQMISQSITGAKELIASVMAELKRKRDLR